MDGGRRKRMLTFEMSAKQAKVWRFKHKWVDPKKRRSLFDAFAKANSFDPLDVEKWYSVSLKKFIKFVSSGREELSLLQQKLTVNREEEQWSVITNQFSKL